MRPQNGKRYKSMDDTLRTIELLLREIAEHIAAATRTDRNAAAVKLHRVAAIATTWAFTLESSRR